MISPDRLPRREVKFYKYSVCGNTFIIVDETATPLVDDNERSQFARWALDAACGIGGADNVLYLATGYSAGTHFRSFRIFEHDGSESLSCGNGLLCAADVLGRTAGVADEHPLRQWELLTELPTGSPRTVEVGLSLTPQGPWVKVGHPRRIPPELLARQKMSGEAPVLQAGSDGDPLEWISDLSVEVCSDDSGSPRTLRFSGWLTFTGEPHLVLILDHGTPGDLGAVLFPSCDDDPGVKKRGEEFMEELGLAVNHKYKWLFPEGVHVNLVDVMSCDGLIRYRTWERAINKETMACGTGALASAFVCRNRGLIREAHLALLPYRCRTRLPGAALHVHDDCDGLTLQGKPMLVCEGIVPAGAAASSTELHAGPAMAFGG